MSNIPHTVRLSRAGEARAIADRHRNRAKRIRALRDSMRTRLGYTRLDQQLRFEQRMATKWDNIARGLEAGTSSPIPRKETHR